MNRLLTSQRGRAGAGCQVSQARGLDDALLKLEDGCPGLGDCSIGSALVFIDHLLDGFKLRDFASMGNPDFAAQAAGAANLLEINLAVEGLLAWKPSLEEMSLVALKRENLVVGHGA